MWCQYGTFPLNNFSNKKTLSKQQLNLLVTNTKSMANIMVNHDLQNLYYLKKNYYLFPDDPGILILYNFVISVSATNIHTFTNFSLQFMLLYVLFCKACRCSNSHPLKYKDFRRAGNSLIGFPSKSLVFCKKMSE